MVNPFFKNNGPFKILEIINFLNIKDNDLNKNIEIQDIKDLITSTDKDITFFHSKKYVDIAQKTKASFCITAEGLKNSLPNSVQNKFNFDEGEQLSIITIRGLGVTEIQNQIDQLMYWFGLFVKEINNFDKELGSKKE